MGRTLAFALDDYFTVEDDEDEEEVSAMSPVSEEKDTAIGG